jgi:hypothetical protein
MYTDCRQTSHILVQSARGERICCARLKATPWGVGGHTLAVCGQVFADMGPLGRAAYCIARQKSVWESAIRWGYASKTEDENLRLYRASVLSRE